MKTLRIALDFDGTIHSYVTPWVNKETISDPPIAGSLDWIRRCLELGHTIIIHTARFSPDADIQAVADALDAWFTHWGLEIEYVTEMDYHVVVGKPKADIYMDDRGYRFLGTYPDPANLPWKSWYK